MPTRSTMLPPDGIASAALLTSSRNTDSSSRRSARTCARPSPTCASVSATSDTLRGSSPSSVRPRLVTKPARSTSVAHMYSCPLNASSCRVSCAARSAAVLICVKSSAAASLPAATTPSSACPMTVVSRLLNQWAMPPARRPTACIFASATCRSRSACSATSRALSRAVRNRRVMSNPTCTTTTSANPPSTATSPLTVAWTSRPRQAPRWPQSAGG